MDSDKTKPINNLVLYRRRMGFTQKQVSTLLRQASPRMISQYEHGRANPPLLIALALEIIYRVPVAFLFPASYEALRNRIRQQEEFLAGPNQRPLF
jgi:transcriptional regulator with XRE-family HTH domain